MNYIETKSPALDDRVYQTHKIALLIELMRDQGISADRCLQGTELTVESVYDSNSRISKREIIAIYRNVVQQTKDPAVGLKAGKNVKVTHYGLYGYALLSSRNLRDALLFGIRYHGLADSTVQIALESDKNIASLVLTDLLGIDDIVPFSIEFQYGLTLSILQDILGQQFDFIECFASYPRPEYSTYYNDLLGCEVYFDQPQNACRFDAGWLDQPLLRSNPITLEMVRKICDQKLKELRKTSSIVKQVHDIMIADAGKFPAISDVASMLNITSRTLRRKLKNEGTSYHDILADIRKNLAIEYLTSTNMSIEDIAERLGYTDAANFRHAFKRWTNKTPNMFRG